MTKFLFALEDYFDALSRERQGLISGWLTGLIGSVCATSGDMLVLARRI